MPGTKWWMWRPPTLTFSNGHQRSRIPQVESAHQGEGTEEAGEQVEEDRLAARGGRVAADRDADRVERRRRGRFDQAGSPSLLLVRAPPQHAAELAGEDGAGAAEGDGGEPDRRPL